MGLDGFTNGQVLQAGIAATLTPDFWLPDHGFVSMQNLATNQVTSVGINARPGITSAGGSAEWIIEGVSADLPDFLPVTFSDCARAAPPRSPRHPSPRPRRPSWSGKAGPDRAFPALAAAG